jgi:hypothetical protein
LTSLESKKKKKEKEVKEEEICQKTQLLAPVGTISRDTKLRNAALMLFFVG